MIYAQVVNCEADWTLVVESIQKIKVLIPLKSISGLYFPLPCVVVPASELTLIFSGFILGLFLVVPALPSCFGSVFLALSIFAELLGCSLFHEGSSTHTAD